MKKILFSLALMIFLLPSYSQEADGRAIGNFFKASGTPPNPKVPIIWNRYYTNEGLLEIYRQLEQAHPDLIRLESIGKSFEGRDLWLLTVTNHNNRPHREKPAL